MSPEPCRAERPKRQRAHPTRRGGAPAPPPGRRRRGPCPTRFTATRKDPPTSHVGTRAKLLTFNTRYTYSTRALSLTNSDRNYSHSKPAIQHEYLQPTLPACVPPAVVYGLSIASILSHSFLIVCSLVSFYSILRLSIRAYLELSISFLWIGFHEL